MGSPLLVWLLLVAVCTVSFLGESSAVCCTDYMTLKFKVRDNNCGTLNAQRVDDFCQIRICGDGSRVVGYYCGKGPCNVFGCDCEGGCRHGDWVDSFLARNRRHEVSVVDAIESNGADSVRNTAKSGLGFLNLLDYFK